ncbi:hypothetical protein A3I51_04275 [Candidatus Gottesmanbacteria bacterium RIFCSPLOWO2_02_FULL_38_8]|uniref:Bacterial Ig-like domain-containing protein n=1 Tax=Candidatus Gottesmanbacteria bacterium RIFCSPLOWO2_02_FULL_38_8 TaxID=1798397 RepID=A0A1F6B2A1_9BACT|nr:MAG: hypothetical protein A3I51_04275 [Candidatus Gottesmanbacteria bacterium RIFCSPLOWO2_02_FULL_38_8]
MEIYINGNFQESIDGAVIIRTLNIDNGIRRIKVKATDEDGRSGESEITIGINTSAEPTLIPQPTQTPVVSPVPT